LPTFAALAGVFLAAPAMAQGASPAAPTDLTRPQYDTETPQYDVTGTMAKAPKTVVAEVDGRPITLGDVGDAIRALPMAIAQRPFDVLFHQAREELVQRQALVVRAMQTGLDEDPAIKRQIQAATSRILSDAYLQRETAAHVTEQMLLDAYDRVYKGKPGVDEVRFQLILVATQREAIDIIKELQGGADFATVARRSSKDPTSVIGGEVAFVNREGLTPEIGAVAFALAPGEVTRYPVAAAGAWYVLKVEERRQAETPPFVVVREALRRYLQRQEVRGVVKAALEKMTIREYEITGKEQSTGAQ
jgi:peptidyl-prolyl cis-trans isomerase C